MNKKYFLCGLTGWCLEVFWTGLGSAIFADKTLASYTSLWMFPIYATAIVIEPMSIFLRKRGYNVIERGAVYAMAIFLTEFLSGSLLKLLGCCPWDYSISPVNINGVIRLDYLPVWFITGLIYEMVLCPELRPGLVHLLPKKGLLQKKKGD